MWCIWPKRGREGRRRSGVWWSENDGGVECASGHVPCALGEWT